MQAQEGQWDFARKSGGPRLNSFLFSLCHTAGHYTTCAAHTLMSVFVWSFLSGFVRTQVWIHADPSWIPTDLFSAVGNVGWPIRVLGCLWDFFLAPHCSCTTDASTAAAYFLITVEDPHKTVYTRQAMIPPKSCTLDPSRCLQQTLSPLTSNISCLVKHSLVCASKKRESTFSHLGSKKWSRLFFKNLFPIFVWIQVLLILGLKQEFI